MFETGNETGNLSANSNFQSEWWTSKLVAPIAVAFVFRLVILAVMLIRVGPGSVVRVDTNSYLDPGRNLVLHGYFDNQGLPELARTPGYPVFVAVTSLAGLPEAAMCNVILAVFSVILVWKLGRMLSGNDKVALTAAWLFALEPIAASFSVVLLSESLFLALLLLSLERLVMFLRKRRLPLLVAAGLWLSAAIFVRPVAYYLPLALALGLSLVFARPSLLRFLRQEPLTEAAGLWWKAPAVLLITVLPWLATWQVRNLVETGYGGFSSISDVNLYFFNAAEVLARVQHRDFYDVQKELGFSPLDHHKVTSYNMPPYIAVHPEQAGWNQKQRLSFMHAEALNIIREHWQVYLLSCSSTLAKIVSDSGTAHFVNILTVQKAEPDTGAEGKGLITGEPVSRWTHSDSDPARKSLLLLFVKAVLTVIMLGLYLLGVRGVVVFAREAFRGDLPLAYLWMMLGTLFYFLTVTALAAGPIVDARYRIPIMPIICILAAIGFQRKMNTAQISSAGLQ